MFGMKPITGAMIDSLLWSASLLGILLLFATFIRVRFQFLKKYYISASLIAGLIGLILGPEVLGVIPKDVISSWGALSGRLIIVVLAPMLITGSFPQLGKLGRVTASQSVWSWLATAAQYAVPCLMSALLFTPVMGVNPLFASVLEQGWAGGHGTAGGMKMVFDSLHYVDGASLSITSATVGLLYGVVGGTIAINYAARKGYIHNVTTHDEKVDELLGHDHSEVGSNITISRNVIDIFAFHAGLVGGAIVIGYLLMRAMKLFFNFNLYWFIAAMLGGLVVQALIIKTKYNKCIDRPTMSRIQGLALEFLVAGAIASVKITVIVKYALPLIIQQGAFMIIMPALLFFFGPRLFKTNWFEKTHRGIWDCLWRGSNRFPAAAAGGSGTEDRISRSFRCQPSLLLSFHRRWHPYQYDAEPDCTVWESDRRLCLDRSLPGYRPDCPGGRTAEIYQASCLIGI